MSKKLLTFLTLLTLFFGVGWADETVFYTLDGTKTGGTNGYATESDITQNGMSWTVMGNTLESPWRIGGKSLTNAYRPITSKTAMGSAISKVTIEIGSFSSTITVGGVHLYVYSDQNLTNQLADIQKTVTANSTIEFTPSSGTEQWPTGAYYKIQFTVNVSSGSNNYFQFKNAKFYANGGLDQAATPTFNPGTGSYTEAQTVTISSTTNGATIYYTTNGDTPTTSSSSISNGGTVSINESCTLKAIAVASGYSNSEVATATYTIDTTPSGTRTATFDATVDKDADNTTQGEGSITKTPVTFACDNGILGNGEQYRLYSGSETTFSVPNGSGYKIVKIEFTGTETSRPLSNLSTTTGNYTATSLSGTWIGEAESVTFTASAQTRATLITVYYTAPAGATYYYLVGTFNMDGNDWVQGDANYMFTENNGVYELNGVDIPDETEFKIIKVQGNTTKWFGGNGGGSHYGLHSGHHTNINLVEGYDNFYLQPGAITNFSFTMNNDNPDKLTVSRDAQFFVKGDFNGWNREAMTATATGWTIEQVISKANQFGFVDEWGYWYGGRDWWINEEHLDTRLEIKPDGNFYMNIDGTDDYTLTVNSAKDTLTVSKIEVPTGDEYVLVTDATTLSAGDRVIVTNSKTAGTANAMGADRGNNRGTAEVTITSDIKITPGSDVQILSLEGDASCWYFNAGDNTYLRADGGSSNNYLKTGVMHDNAKASITSGSNDIAEIVFQITGNRKYLRYNGSNNPPIFSCYESGKQSPVYLFKKVEVEERATPPVITPASQNVKGGLLEGVMITAADSATIHYTLDGSEPTIDSPVFDGQAFNVTGTGGERKMVRAIAVEANKAPSYPASVTYTFQAPATPIISPEAGTFETPVNVTISSTDGGDIYYLVDPEEAPTNAAAVIDGNQVYTEGETEIILSENGTHKVYAAVDLNGITSWAQATYTINLPVTLANLVTNGYTGEDYTISDELVAVKCVEVGNDAYLWCKDQGNASIVKTENPDPENIVDYMKANHFFNGNWDQSNWIALIFKNVSPDDMMAIKGYEGKRISEGTLKGKYISRENYAMQMNTTTLTTLDGGSYSPNVYCAANFLYRNQNGNATGHEPDGTPTDEHYFFVNPKVQEFCDITFAVWHPESDYYDGYFTLPAPDSTNNTANIYGAFKVDWTLNAPCGDVSEYLSANPGEAYRFKAIVHQQIKKSSSDLRENTPVTPQSGVRPEGGYVVYPVGFDPTNEANIVTRIENVAVDGTGKAVAGVKYYNLAGIESDRPFEGVNIVVTTYTDGSRSSSKVLK